MTHRDGDTPALAVHTPEIEYCRVREIVKAEEAERASHDVDKKKEGSFDTTFRQVGQGGHRITPVSALCGLQRSHSFGKALRML